MQLAAEREYGGPCLRGGDPGFVVVDECRSHAPHETLQDILRQARAFGAWLISLRFFWATLMFGFGVALGAMLP